MAGILARIAKLRLWARRALYGPQALAFLPAAVLAAFWLGGETFLLAAALGLPVLFVLTGFGPEPRAPTSENDAGLAGDLPEMADKVLARARLANLSTACILLEVDGLDDAVDLPGEAGSDALRDMVLGRLRGTLRRGDLAARIGGNRYAVLLGPSLRLDLEALLQLSSRMQASIEEPAVIEKVTRYLSASIGFCSSVRLEEGASGKQFIEAAQIALAEALANRPSAIRAWSENMRAAYSVQNSLKGEVDHALVNGQIQPWFQPQVCTSTGDITGVEALARWLHPERGVIPPAQFLRLLEETGKMAQLGEVILQHSLTALRSWGQAGLLIPRVSINFSYDELRDPRLVERIGWELDRFGLAPHRLGIEVLETVIASSPEGSVARNIVALGELGCHIDLDDFGTGHASITSLRRFKVHRLKIDRSFVTRIDRDEDQHRMLAAILGMADRLGLETLAEGVESVGEHALLAQLGCDHVQGFGIVRPMPVDQLVDWAKQHRARIAEAQRLGRSSD